jgi:hypothetical protein
LTRSPRAGRETLSRAHRAEDVPAASVLDDSAFGDGTRFGAGTVFVRCRAIPGPAGVKRLELAGIAVFVRRTTGGPGEHRRAGVVSAPASECTGDHQTGHSDASGGQSRARSQDPVQSGHGSTCSGGVGVQLAPTCSTRAPILSQMESDATMAGSREAAGPRCPSTKLRRVCMLSYKRIDTTRWLAGSSASSGTSRRIAYSRVDNRALQRPALVLVSKTIVFDRFAYQNTPGHHARECHRDGCAFRLVSLSLEPDWHPWRRSVAGVDGSERGRSGSSEAWLGV